MTEEKARPPTDSEEREALKELLRLYDWRFELAEREKDPRNISEAPFAHETLRLLRQYGTEKKAAWGVARHVLAALGEARGTASVSESTNSEQGAHPDAVCKNGHYAGGWPPSTITCRICGEMLQRRPRTEASEQGALRASLDDLRAQLAEAEARAEAWRKAAGDMLEVEMDRSDKDALRALFKKGEALQKDAAASGRHLQPTAEEFAIRIRAHRAATTEASGDTPTAPPAPDLLRENARLREEVGQANECIRNREEGAYHWHERAERAEAENTPLEENARLLYEAFQGVRERLEQVADALHVCGERTVRDALAQVIRDAEGALAAYAAADAARVTGTTSENAAIRKPAPAHDPASCQDCGGDAGPQKDDR